ISPIKDVAELIINMTGSSSKLVHLPPLKDGDMTRRQPDITKMRTILNRELVPLEIGLEKILTSGRF
ncbi:MAG: udp-glucose 4-epimerase, partial [Bacteroidota bacterium]